MTSWNDSLKKATRVFNDTPNHNYLMGSKPDNYKENPQEFINIVGETLGTSEWKLVTQKEINKTAKEGDINIWAPSSAH